MNKPRLLQAIGASGRPSIRRAAFVACASLATAAVALISPVVAQSSGSAGGTQKPLRAPVTSPLPRLAEQSVHLMVEMNTPAAGTVYAQALKEAQASTPSTPARIPLANAGQAVPRVQISASAANLVKSQVQQNDNAQRSLLPALNSLGAKVLYRTQRSYNGIAVVVSRDKVAEIAKLPGVKAIHAMVAKYPTAFSSVDFIGTRAFWTRAYEQGVGLHGENIKVADIDSGLDYIHTNFGGPGTQAAYDQVTDAGPNQYFPSAKVPGGFDFAGDAYNGGNDPMPDQNPFDTGGHGTGTASIIGGFGVNFGGTTYQGNYDRDTPISSLRISTGIAPLAKLYPLRVFGTSGSTNLVTEAIEYAMDPNGDGDFSDRMDVINMSLGANEGYPDDPDSIAATQAAEAGILVCSAAGNAGDTYYVVSSPSVAGETLSVAGTYNDQSGFIYDVTVTGNQPAALRGKTVFGDYGNGSPHTSGLTGDVVYAIPHNGSTAFSNAAQVSGKIVLIDRGSVTFQTKVNNAQAAGAIGIIVANNQGDPITMSETSTVPSVMISTAAGDALKSAALFDPNDGTSKSTPPANVTIKNGTGTVQRNTDRADTIPSYSSRGPRTSDSAMKPDIAAPAEVVSIAVHGTGDGVGLFNGTSSATPHVAGAMALMRQLHPTWSVQELNALAMNTATHDLFTAPPNSSPAPTQYGLGRIGAGRIDLAKASKANVIAYELVGEVGPLPGGSTTVAPKDAGTVVSTGVGGVSFGVVEVPVDSSVTLTKRVRVSNKGTKPVKYTLSRQDVTQVGDATFDTTAPLTFTVAAGGTTDIPVRFRATGSTLRHTHDQSVSETQNSPFGAFPRQWLPEQGSYAVLTPGAASGEPVIRVALYAAPKPVASMHVTRTSLQPTGAAGDFDIRLSGDPIVTGGTPSEGGILSLVKPFQLQYTNPNAGGAGTAVTDPNVVKYAGVTSDYTPNGTGATISFGIDGFGDAATPFFYSSDREVFIDVDGDFRPDFVLYADSLGRAAGGGLDNIYYTVVADLNNGGATIEYPVNGLTSDQRDTNSFNNSATVLSVFAGDIGLVGESGNLPTTFNYLVATFDRDGNEVMETPFMTYDLANPGVNVNGGLPDGEPSFYADRTSTAIPVHYDGSTYANQKTQGVLLLHMHNGKGERSEVVKLLKPTISSFTPTSGKVGSSVTISGSNFGSGTIVSFSDANGNQTVQALGVQLISDRTIVARVPNGAETGKIKVQNAAGSSTSTQTFTVTP